MSTKPSRIGSKIKSFLFFFPRFFIFLLVIGLIILGICGIVIGNIYIFNHIFSWIPILWLSSIVLFVFFITEISILCGICYILFEVDDGWDEEV